MGRQAYVNRLALQRYANPLLLPRSFSQCYIDHLKGRSPYEAPERPPGTPGVSDTPAQRRTSNVYAEGYVQEYDERGHPVNPESKAFGKELRKAKNDILSTMGIVVSGEDGGVGVPNEQQKVNMIAAENDYGLVMATLDQMSVFLGSWWTSSLTGRIQTFRSYTHAPLMDVISSERASGGFMGFYFAGIPAWSMSTCLSICRHHPLERLIVILESCVMRYSPNELCSKIVRASFSAIHHATKGAFLILAVQTYMYSLLQSLHLITHRYMPSASFLIPFGELAPTQLVSLPMDFSFGSLANFGLDLLKTPSLMVYLYVYLRPVLELRLYRLIRRRLPKPSLADELSIRVALENDLIDWMVPTLGRRSDEENRRNHLTLYEDVKYELAILWNWALSWFRFKRNKASSRGAKASPRNGRPRDTRTREERIESLRQCVQVLQNELGASESRHGQSRSSNQRSRTLPELTAAEHAEDTLAGPNDPSVAVRTPATETSDRILQNEENRVSQSPDAMSTDYLSEMAPFGRTRTVTSTDGQPHQPTIDAPRGNGGPENGRASRSNTLFSRPSSPETSPPTSPRVRASLIHQNSDIITMQLELLGNRNAQGQGQTNLRPRTGNENINTEEASTERLRSITEILETVLAEQDNGNSTVFDSDAMDRDGLSNLTARAPVDAASQNRQDAAQAEGPTLDSALDAPIPAVANILPDSLEESGNEDAHDEPQDAEIEPGNLDPPLPPPASNINPSQPTESPRHPAHRVTILSSHPVDSLASNLASMVTTIIFLPLESLYLRSLASSYLSSRGRSFANVRPLAAWGGGGSRCDILAYVGKVSLMLGVQAAVNASVWGVISGAAIRIGKKFCGWGNL